MRNTNEVIRLIKGVTYLCMAAILIWLQASAALAQEPVRGIEPPNDAGASGRVPGMNPKASNHTAIVAMAKPLTLPVPYYPQLAVKYRIMGVVKIAVEIDTNGKITSANALDGPMVLRRSALEAAYLANFSPAQVGGKPAKTKGVINYIFRLADFKPEEIRALPMKPDSRTSFTAMPPAESGESKVPDTVTTKGAITEKVGTIPVKTDSLATATAIPVRDGGPSTVPNTVILKGDLKEKVNAVKLDPTSSGPDRLPGESRKSSVHDIVHLKGAIPEKVSAAPAKSDTAASVANKSAVESVRSPVGSTDLKAPHPVGSKGAMTETLGTIPVKTDPAASVANKPAAESGKSSVEAGQPKVETGKPAVERAESKVPDTLNSKGDRIEKAIAVPVKTDTAATVANKAAVESGKPPVESGDSKAPDPINFKGAITETLGTIPVKTDPAASVANKPAAESGKPSVESGGAKVPDSDNPNGDKNATAITTASQPVITPLSLTTTYRVGVGDILDVRILGDTSKKSTLFSVLEGGVLDYHEAGDPVVGGMTLEEIRVLLTAELKRRSSDAVPKLAVGVRDYASHTVTVSGLVAVPGNKILRREAVPLYVALAEAQPRPDADRVQIACRATGQITLLSLNDPLAMETLVHSGDVINVTPRPSEFYYIAGFVNVPGQKSLPLGITLMQAIMSAGGVSRPNAARVEIGRQRPDGFVSFEKYDLKEIKAGNMKDPTLRAGDRIEVLKP
jgi:TonB family protein